MKPIEEWVEDFTTEIEGEYYCEKKPNPECGERMKAKWRTKYGNIKVKIDGHNFDSKKEARRYRELLLLEAAGEIRALELQPRYVLQEAFYDNQGTPYRPITYKADFRYREGGQLVVEDVKSEPTKRKADYVIRKKLLIKQNPEIVFREI